MSDSIQYKRCSPYGAPIALLVLPMLVVSFAEWTSKNNVAHIKKAEVKLLEQDIRLESGIFPLKSERRAIAFGTKDAPQMEHPMQCIAGSDYD